MSCSAVVGLSGLLLLLFLLLSEHFFPFAKNLLVEEVGPFEKEVGQELGRVFGYLFAELDQSFGEVWHHIVHQVLSDWLRPLVEEISLLLSDLFQPCCLLRLADPPAFGLFSLDTFAFHCLLFVPKMVFFLASGLSLVTTMA